MDIASSNSIRKFVSILTCFMRLYLNNVIWTTFRGFYCIQLCIMKLHSLYIISRNKNFSSFLSLKLIVPSNYDMSNRVKKMPVHSSLRVYFRIAIYLIVSTHNQIPLVLIIIAHTFKLKYAPPIENI